MRLIDADKIDFGKVFIGASGFAKDTREAAQNLIDSQPTAYNVDKVVERLEEMRLKREEQLRVCADNDMADYFRCKMSAIAEAVEIVKSGGMAAGDGVERGGKTLTPPALAPVFPAAAAHSTRKPGRSQTACPSAAGTG